MRFPVYEILYVLNRNLQESVGILEQIKKSPGIPRDEFEAYQVEIQHLRSEATQDVLEIMNDAELDEAAKLDRKRKAYTDGIRDLDDVYFEGQQREEERRKQGLPPLIGVLPDSTKDSNADPTLIVAHIIDPQTERCDPDDRSLRWSCYCLADCIPFDGFRIGDRKVADLLR